MNTRLPAALVVLGMNMAGVALAGDGPDAEVNPATGQIESIGADRIGEQYDLRHTVDPGQGAPQEAISLTLAPEDDLRPRMAITPGGVAWVVWWRDSSVDAVLCRNRDASGAWLPERLVSLPGESSRNPVIALHAGKAWVAYDFSASGGTGIGAVAIDDTPDPFGRAHLGTSIVSGPVDAQIHSASGHLWVTWIQDGSRVGWSELEAQSQTWLPVSFEPYGQADGVAGARSRIGSQVLAP